VRIVQGLNFLTILAMCAAAIVRFTYFGKDDGPTDPFFYIFTFYLFPFAGLLLISELRYERVLKYFEFLGYQYGKGMFMLFVALLLFDTTYPADTAISVFMSLVGIFNLILMCVAPGLHTEALSLFKKDKEKNEIETESENGSENEANEHDGLLPRTYGASRNDSSNKPQQSTMGH
jgi:peptidoglycan/LPS O-acetylase OafA/YrhL